jgi:threonine dehydratase
VGDTLADGLAGNLEPGAVTPQLAAQADALHTVGEDRIEDAIRALAREHGLVAEGSAVTGLAAVRAGLVAPRDGERLVVVVTGRNIAIPLLAQVLRS